MKLTPAKIKMIRQIQHQAERLIKTGNAPEEVLQAMAVSVNLVRVEHGVDEVQIREIFETEVF